MTEETAEKIADVVIGVAVVSAAYYVLRDPGLRRAAGQLVRRTLASSGPWLYTELRHAWGETSGERGSGLQSGWATAGAASSAPRAPGV